MPSRKDDWFKPNHSDCLDPAHENASADDRAMSSKEFDMLCVAIGRLTPQRRRVLTLRAIYKYSCRDIAVHLGMSVGTVHRHLAAGLEAVHAARESIEADEGALYAQMIALRNGNGPLSRAT